MRLEPGSLYDYEARARQVLPHDYWDFIAGGSKLDFVHLRGIANHVHEAVKQDTWNFYHVSLML